MSRKVTITLVAAAAFAVTALASTSSYARSVALPAFGGHGPSTIGTLRGPRQPISHAFIPRRDQGHRPCTIVKGFKPCPPGTPVPPIWVRHHHHHHHHWVFRGGRWIVDDAVEEAAPVVATPAPAVSAGPCSCLTKTYTPTGLAVFADVCTKESASAPAMDDHADASQAPTTSVPAKATPIAEVPTAPNFAGRTYEDYLAANPQLARPETSSAAPRQQ